MTTIKKFMVAITFDTDWVSEELVAPIAQILKSKKLKATFFLTKEHDCLKRCHLFEINPHFNFEGNWTTYEKEFRRFKKNVPKSLGIRNHSLYNHERLRMIWQDNNLRYSSNVLQPLMAGIKPYFISKKIVELPIFFLDYWYMERYNHPKFSLKAIDLQEGLKIFDFHPIHLALNTPSLSYYENYKRTKRIVTYPGKGTRTLFFELIDYLEKNKIPTYTLKEVMRTAKLKK